MSERYPKSRLELLDEEYKPSTWWQLLAVSILLLIVFTAGDFANIYMILSDVLTQNPVVLLLFAAVLCLLFNFLPTILARLIRLRQAKMINVPNFFLIAIPVVFLLLLASVFFVRYATREQEFYTSSLMQSVASGSGNQQATASPAALPMVFLMAALPIGTATVSFFISWMTDPVQEKIYRLKKQRIRLFEHLAQLKAFMAECTDRQYQTRLMTEDAAKYAVAMNTIEAEKLHLQDYYRARLAEHLGNPTSTSILSAPHTNAPVSKSAEIVPTTKESKKQIRRRSK
ncbi:hypothetical protein [Dehalobacter restrictus]|uniref:hypothetical protein n=1 Tax=Dehalobacter restrictus TaxID=55583 RepID=UPI00338EC784